MIDLIIQPKTEGKGRSFASTMVAHVLEKHLSPDGNDAHRPIFLAFAGTENELRPFVANLRLGRKAEAGYRGRQKYEVLKSAGYQCAWQRTPKGALVTLFAPDLFAFDPGMVDPKGVEFVILPARTWLKPVDAPVPACVPEDKVDFVRALAPLFIAYLDRRTRCPLVPDPRFYVQVLANAIDQGMAGLAPQDTWRRGWGQVAHFEERGTEAIGLAPGLTFRASHETLETFLADQVREFFAAEAPQSKRAA